MPTKNFLEFTPDELMGKTVLNTTSNGSMSSSSRLAKIVHVTKTAFKISDSDSLYSLINGSVKGKDNSRMNWGNHNDCELVTEDEANELRKAWTEKKEKHRLFKSIEDKLKITDLTLEQVRSIAAIVNKV